MKNLILATSLLASLLFVGCGPQNQTTGNVNATVTSNGACPAGYWYTNGQCYNGTSSIPSNFNYNTGYYADNWSGTTSLQVTNNQKMKDLYKLGMGVCDRAANTYGQASCDYYITGYTDLIVQFPNQLNGNALVTIIARPRQNPYFNYQAQLPNGWGLLGTAIGMFTGIYIPDPTYYQGAYRNPLQVQMAVSPINNSQGFSASGYGDAWTGLNQTLITIEVQNGNTNSTNLNYVLKIGGVAAAQGVMTRCQYQNCGL